MSFKKIYENMKQWNEMKKTIEDLQVEIESIIKIQTEGQMEIKKIRHSN